MELKSPKWLLLALIIFMNATGGLFIICTTGLQFKGYTYPKGDIILEYGVNPLEIYCIINDKDYLSNHSTPSQELYFTRNAARLNNFQIVNDTTIRLFDDKVTVSSDTYYCNIAGEIVCLNKVLVGTKPQKVHDFSCISYNNDNLTCTWTPEYNPVEVEYGLRFTLPGRVGKVTPITCPRIVTNEVGMKSCTWTLSTIPHYRQSHSIYNFNLTMSNALGNSSMYYRFDHFRYVKPGSPENLRPVNTTTNSIMLHWQMPNTMVSFDPGLQYRILYQCEYGPKEWKLADIKYVKKVDDVYYNLTGLKHAHELCDIRVSLRSNKSNDENMWSSNSSITHRTSSTIPGAAPPVNIGSFQLESSKYKPNITQDVYIYWQEVPEEIRNGDDFHYNVSVIGDDNSTIKLDRTRTAYAHFEGLLKDRDYKFLIWSINDHGESINKSIVTVPRQSKRPKEATRLYKLAHDNGKYELSWEPPPSSDQVDIKNYTIFWCKHTKDRPYQCEGYLGWTEVGKDKRQHNVTLPESDNDVWQFAISVNSEEYSSGMMWASCTVLTGKPLGKIRFFKPKNVTADSIEVSWALDCKDGIPSISGFVIYYCTLVGDPKEGNCKGPQKNVTIPGDSLTTDGIVTGLKSYTTYVLTIAIKTKNGDISEQSDSIQASTLERAPSTPTNLEVVKITNTSIKIKWDRPSEINGKLKAYDITYNNNNKLINLKAEDEPYPQKMLENLTAYQQYTISVKACTPHCSHSVNVTATTKMGTPGKLQQPTVAFQNDSYILVIWNPPLLPGGKNDYYQIKLKQKSIDDYGTLLNVTDKKYPITYCGEDGNANQIFVSVRAVNIMENGSEHIYGPWSDELECLCSNNDYLYIWIVVILLMLMFVPITVFIKRISLYCQIMRNVEMKLPPGLTPIPEWGTTKGQEPQEHQPSADEQQILLVNMTEPRIPSGDSSGCSSAHGSVASDSGTTISSGSDSGTEQNQLRKRSRPVNIGYVSMPTDGINKQRPKTATSGVGGGGGGNYCVLGVDPKKQSESENTYISVSPQEVPKLPFIPCEANTPPSAYVLTGDITKQSNSRYVPLNYPENSDKNPAYVMAGANNMLIPDLVKDKKDENPVFNIARKD